MDPDKKANTVPEKNSESIHGGALDIEFMLQPPNTVFHKEDPIKEALYEEYYYTEGEVVRPVNWHAEKTGYRIINTKE